MVPVPKIVIKTNILVHLSIESSTGDFGKVACADPYRRETSRLLSMVLAVEQSGCVTVARKIDFPECS